MNANRGGLAHRARPVRINIGRVIVGRAVADPPILALEQQLRDTAGTLIRLALIQLLGLTVAFV